MNRTFLDKLKSRKFLAALVGVIVGLAAAFGIDSGEYTEIAGVVTSAVSVVAYIFAEGAVDAAATKIGSGEAVEAPVEVAADDQ
jgi:phage shock protein PspC (stress-responsive transcriptional regulator)